VKTLAFVALLVLAAPVAACDPPSGNFFSVGVNYYAVSPVYRGPVTTAWTGATYYAAPAPAVAYYTGTAWVTAGDRYDRRADRRRGRRAYAAPY
jgi:hypothetical protein